MTMETASLKTKTTFVTFYSFKGGVGRTLALVNAACILAGRGRRILMIDFDLEAPGLTMLASKQLTENKQICPEGLVDLIYDFLSNPESSPIADNGKPTGFTEYICSLNIPKHLIRLKGGKLDLMPCGRLDPKYEERFYKIDFSELYAEGIGQPLFKHLKSIINKSELYDYVFIDSRTGFSDEGGISTRDLAEHIVILTTLNQQNIEGTIRFLERLEKSNWEKGKLIFVLSPIPIGYEELRAKRIRYAKKEIEKKSKYKIDLKLYIPYHPRIALDEEPFIYNWTETPLYTAYEDICYEIQELADDTAVSWANKSIKSFQDGRIKEGEYFLEKVHADNDKIYDQVVNMLMDGILRQIPTFWDNADYILRYLLKSKESGILINCSTILIQIGDYNRASNILIKLLESGYLEKDNNLIISCLTNLAIIYQLRGNYDEAMEKFKSALTKSEEIGDSWHYMLVRHFIAHLYEDQKKYDLAIKEHESIINFEQDQGRVTGPFCVARTFFNQGDYNNSLKELERIMRSGKGIVGEEIYEIKTYYGIVKIKIGDDIEGKRLVENGIEYFKISGNNDKYVQYIIKYIDLMITEKKGKSDKWLKYLDDNWKIINKYGDANRKYKALFLRAKLYLELDMIKKAIKDLNRAINYYRRQNIDSEESLKAKLLLQEAEELALKK